MKKILMLVLVILLFVYGCSKIEISEENYCNIDEECVPSDCCHAYGAVNIKNAPDCSETICTTVCESPLDCGPARIECRNNACVVVED